MMAGSPSLFLSAEHVLVVAATVAGNLLLCRQARRNPGARWVPWFRRGLAAVLVGNAAWTHVHYAATGKWDATFALNCQLCDAAVAACVVALLRPSGTAFELAYFWG